MLQYSIIKTPIFPVKETRVRIKETNIGVGEFKDEYETVFLHCFDSSLNDIDWEDVGRGCRGTVPLSLSLETQGGEAEDDAGGPSGKHRPQRPLTDTR